MTNTERPEKRVVRVRCEHPAMELCQCRRTEADEIVARWPTVAQGPRVDHPGRVRVVLAERRARVDREAPPPWAVDDDARHAVSPLSTMGAWACLALAVLVVLSVVISGLWHWVELRGGRP